MTPDELLVIYIIVILLLYIHYLFFLLMEGIEKNKSGLNDFIDSKLSNRIDTRISNNDFIKVMRTNIKENRNKVYEIIENLQNMGAKISNLEQNQSKPDNMMQIQNTDEIVEEKKPSLKEIIDSIKNDFSQDYEDIEKKLKEKDPGIQIKVVEGDENVWYVLKLYKAENGTNEIFYIPQIKSYYNAKYFDKYYNFIGSGARIMKIEKYCREEDGIIIKGIIS